jgi:MscS family membrane protein
MTAARVIKKCLLPLVSLVVFFVFYGAYVTKVKEGMRISWHGVLDKLFFVVAVVLLAYWVTSVTTALMQWYGDRVAERTHTSLDDDFMPLMRKLAGIVIWVVALVVILNYLGVNITAMIATLGVGSLAIALAAQDTIANVIAGFLIVIDRPFRVGDRIMLPSGEKVEVLRVGNRRSKFRAEDGSIVIVPNVDLSKSRIVNYTYGDRD